MKFSNSYFQYISFPIILVAYSLFQSGCNKKEVVNPHVPDQISPVFKMEHIFIHIGGNDYIQFFTRCTSENIKLFSATISDPGNNVCTYEYYSDTTDYLIFLKDKKFTFPEDFSKQPGIWRFKYSGKRYNDDSDFNSFVNDTIAN